jgi:hypothetical protein
MESGPSAKLMNLVKEKQIIRYRPVSAKFPCRNLYVYHDGEALDHAVQLKDPVQAVQVGSNFFICAF